MYPRSKLLVTELTGALADGDTVSVVIQGLTLRAGAALGAAAQVLGTDRVVRDDVAGTHALIGTVLVYLASLTWQLYRGKVKVYTNYAWEVKGQSLFKLCSGDKRP